jgi:DNA repair protein RecO (recombination protein O)
MSQSYQIEGIVLARKDFGENDRLVTLLTPELGILKAVAPGSRKYKSSLRGQVELFVVNELMLIKGKSLDRLIQAQTLKSHRGLCGDLAKLSAAQYIAELVLCIGLSDQPQIDLYKLLLEYLELIESTVIQQSLIIHLTMMVFKLLKIAGIEPCVDRCCISQEPLVIDFSRADDYLGFSFNDGGIVKIGSSEVTFEAKLGSIELSLLQYLGNSQLPEPDLRGYPRTWYKIEQILREYAQYHLNYSLRSSVLLSSLSLGNF